MPGALLAAHYCRSRSCFRWIVHAPSGGEREAAGDAIRAAGKVVWDRSRLRMTRWVACRGPGPGWAGAGEHVALLQSRRRAAEHVATAERENMVLDSVASISHHLFTVDKVLACLSLDSELMPKHHELNSYAVWLGEQCFVVLQFCIASSRIRSILFVGVDEDGEQRPVSSSASSTFGGG